MNAFLIAVAAVTAAAPKPSAAHEMGVGEMIDVATIVCPLNQSNGAQREAAKAAHMSKRDSDVMIALCAMYHYGRATAFGDNAEAIREGWRN